MKTTSFIKFISLFLLILFISCEENDDESNENEACELSYLRTFIQDTDGSTSVILFESTELTSESDVKYFWSVDGIAQEDHDTTLEYTFTENGEYEVCIFAETPECPNGVEYCDTITIEYISDEIRCEISHTNTVIQNTNNSTSVILFESTELISEYDVKYFWSVDGIFQEDHDTTLEYTFTENGEYEVCISTETPECPYGVEYCETINITSITEETSCEMSIIVDQMAN
uniref:hypothetical protein n=1 Tax=Aquimarina pacifica TaxID=1296415 RepID=UPI000550B519